MESKTHITSNNQWKYIIEILILAFTVCSKIYKILKTQVLNTKYFLLYILYNLIYTLRIN